MISSLWQTWRSMSPGRILIELLDVLVVAFLIYRGLLVLRGTRALQAGLGIVLVVLTYGLARWIGLVTLENLFSYLLSSIILVIVVVFQNDIRRALMRIGSTSIFGGWGQSLESRVVDEVIAATTELAKHRTGALIAFEQDATLDEFVVGQGIAVDAAVTKELLVTMFIPESMNKLHDGAVIIRNLRIAKAGVFFPMPEAKNIDASYGSRHRAALGITEETDAVVIVVSEERGTISFCFNGNLVTNLTGDVLRKTLLRIFGRSPKLMRRLTRSKVPEKTEAPASRSALMTPSPGRSVTLPRVSRVMPDPRTATPLESTPRSSKDTDPAAPVVSISDTLLSAQEVTTPMSGITPISRPIPTSNPAPTHATLRPSTASDAAATDPMSKSPGDSP